MPLIRAELRKLFTIRSTYILAIIATLLMGFISYWALGYKGAGGPGLFMEAATTGATIVGTFVAITMVLHVTHEYRYNTIMYTLTSSNSRNKVMLAKILVATVYVIIFTLITMALAVFLTWLGTQVKGGGIAPQDFYYWNAIWTSVFFVWGYTMVGMLVAFLVRHVVGAIVVLLIVPTTVEGLLYLVLKENSKYLPFSALEQVHTHATMTAVNGAAIFGIYLLVGWAITWFLFLKRDAN